MLNRALWRPGMPDDQPVFTHDGSGVLEDFAVVPADDDDEDGPDRFVAYFCAGTTLQDQRLFRASSVSPLGPFDNVQRVYPEVHAHTRLYRCQFGHPGLRLVSQVWPGLPKAGLWMHRDLGDTGLTHRSLFIAPKDGSLYSVAAANPGVLRNRQHGGYDIFFEGRTETVYWRIFHAYWSGQRDALPVVDDVPICDGANPSLLSAYGRTYLYYSRWRPEGGFATHVLVQ